MERSVLARDCQLIFNVRKRRIFFVEFSEGFVSPGSEVGMAPGATSLSKKRTQRRVLPITFSVCRCVRGKRDFVSRKSMRGSRVVVFCILAPARQQARRPLYPARVDAKVATESTFRGREPAVYHNDVEAGVSLDTKKGSWHQERSLALSLLQAECPKHERTAFVLPPAARCFLRDSHPQTGIHA